MAFIGDNLTSSTIQTPTEPSATLSNRLCLACGSNVPNLEDELKYEFPPPPENEIFSSFCELLQISLSGEVVWWDFNPLTDSSRIFCSDCKLELGLLTDLKRRLKELERDLQSGVETFKEKCCRAEPLFENTNAYEKDQRYVKIRMQITQRTDEEIANFQDEVHINISPGRRGRRKYTRRKKEPAAEIVISTLPVVKLSDSDKQIANKYINSSECHETESGTEHNLEVGDDSISDNQNDSLSDVDYEPKTAPPPARRRRGRPPKINKGESKKTYTGKRGRPKGSRTKVKQVSEEKRINERTRANFSEQGEEEGDEAVSSTRPKRRRKTRFKLGKDGEGSDPDYHPSETEGGANNSDPEYDEEDRKHEHLRFDPETGLYQVLRFAFELVDGKYVCLTCRDQQKETTLTKLNVRRHAIRHTSRYSCNQCNYSGSSAVDLQRHNFRSHSESRFIPCPICGKPISAAYERRLKMHIATHYSEQDKQEAIARGEQVFTWAHFKSYGNKESKKKQCDYCGKSFSSKRNLKEHIISKHPGPEAEKLSSTLQELCCKCGKLVLKVQLRHHQERCTKSNQRFLCVTCNKKFYTTSDLKAHKIRSHSLNFPYNCSLCPKGFLTQRRLQLHMNRHQNFRPFVCHNAGCTSAFFTKGNLDRHIRIYHDESGNPKRKPYLKKGHKKIPAKLQSDTIVNLSGGAVQQGHENAVRSEPVTEFLINSPNVVNDGQLLINVSPSTSISLIKP